MLVCQFIFIYLHQPAAPRTPKKLDLQEKFIAHSGEDEKGTSFTSETRTTHDSKTPYHLRGHPPRRWLSKGIPTHPNALNSALGIIISCLRYTQLVKVEIEIFFRKHDFSFRMCLCISMSVVPSLPDLGPRIVTKKTQVIGCVHVRKLC